MNIKHIIWVILFTLCVHLGVAQKGQPHSNFKNWERISTDFFDVYFPGRYFKGANKVAHYAEIVRYELGVLYDYRPEQRYTLVFNAGAEEALRSNLELGRPDRGHGEFLLPKLEGYVVDPGTDRALYEETKKAVADLVQKEFAFGDRVGTALRSDILLYKPEWFEQGLKEYVADGWTFKDEMWLNSLGREDDLLNIAFEGEKKIHRIVRKSIWHFITHEYGEQKISEIFYLVNIAHSIESGIISVLGITLNTLTERWREYMLSRASSQRQGRIPMQNVNGLEEIPIKAGYTLTSFAYDPVHQRIAMYLNQRGKHSVWIYEIADKDYKRLPIQTGFITENADLLDFSLPLAWSPGGDYLVTTVFERKATQLVYYEVSTQTLSRFALRTDLYRILDIDWSHDGQTLALSARHNGRTDIFTTPALEANLNGITNDPFDNIQPQWSLDDRSIFFSSNRDTTGLRIENAMWESVYNNFDIYQYTLGQGKLNRLTNSPSFNEHMPYPLSRNDLAMVSDESGIYNVNLLNISQKSISSFTNLAGGIDKAYMDNKAFIAATPVAGGLRLFYGDFDDLRGDRTPVRTILRQEYETRFIEQQSRRKAEAAKKPKVEPKQEVVQNEPEQKPSDSQKETQKEEDEPVRYYLFDEDEEPYELKTPSTQPKRQQTITNSPSMLPSIFGDEPKPRWEDILVDRPVKAGNHWGVDHLGFNVNYHPIAGYGMQFDLGYSDLLKNHRISVSATPYFKIRNHDARARYDYLALRPDLYAEVKYKSRLYEQESIFSPLDTFNFQYSQIALTLGAAYPLNRHLSVGIEAGAERLVRNDLKLTSSELENESDNVLRGKAFLRFDNVLEREGYKIKGLQMELAGNGYYSLEMSDLAFYTISLSGAYYLPLIDNIVLATQFRAGISEAPDINGETNVEGRQSFYIGGYDNQIIGAEFEQGNSGRVEVEDIALGLYDFIYQDFRFPNRGFDFFARNGSRFVMTNFELRIPLSRILKTSLNSGSLYNLELIPFVDVGTVWDEGNPFDSKRPTDKQFVNSGPIVVELQTLKNPFLISFGSGLRTNVINYSMRIDLAWGIDDNTLQAPILMLSLARNF